MRTTVGTLACLAAGLLGCSSRRPVPSDYGIPRCPAAADRLLTDDVLECWFDAPGGRWRTLSHVSLMDVLVVQVEARDTRDAEAIARRFVAVEIGTFSEILLYARPESLTPSSRIRRIRWTRGAGYETLDFPASPFPPSGRPD